jgi:hypothetical protein
VMRQVIVFQPTNDIGLGVGWRTQKLDACNSEAC